MTNNLKEIRLITSPVSLIEARKIITWIKPHLYKINKNNPVGELKNIRKGESEESVSLLVSYQKELKPREFAAKIVELLSGELGIAEEDIVCKKEVVSFPYEDKQVDLFFCDDSEYIYKFNYYSHWPLFPILAIIVHKMNMVLNSDGLHLKIFDNESRWVRNLLISRDVSEILSFLGLSSIEPARNFNSENEAFYFICKSKYFNPELFKEKNIAKLMRMNNCEKYASWIKYLDTYVIGGTRKDFHLPQGRYFYAQAVRTHFRNINVDSERSIMLETEQSRDKFLLNKLNHKDIWVLSKKNFSGKKINQAKKRFAAYIELTDKTEFSKYLMARNKSAIANDFAVWLVVYQTTLLVENAK